MVTSMSEFWLKREVVTVAADVYRTSVERLIPAPAEKIFDVLADPSRHPEIDGSGGVRRLKSGPARLSLGSTFVMAMGTKVRYRMASTVVVFDENKHLAWQTFSAIKVVSRWGGGRIWEYELEPESGGTLVRETWDISQEVGRGKTGLLQEDRTRQYMIKAMESTLERLEKVVTD